MKFEMFPLKPAEPLQVEDRGDNQFSINGKAPGRQFEEQYVEFGGFFGTYGPQVFAAAPDLLAALKEALPYIDCTRRGGMKATRTVQIAIAKADASARKAPR